MEAIIVKGAKTHNLKNIDLEIPREKLTVFTGLSGSGKSSLAFDTLYAEGQRRYVESLSIFARHFLDLMPRPDVESIYGLSPAIAIDQKGIGNNPRSTVGTMTEVVDYLRLLFARVGIPHCPVHDLPLSMQTVAFIVDQILQLPEGKRIMILAPVVQEQKGTFKEYFAEALSKGYMRFQIDGEIQMLEQAIALEPDRPHTIAVVVDRLRISPENRARLSESCETAANLGKGRLFVVGMDDQERYDFNTQYACPKCDFTLPTLTPEMFSPNNPKGCCPQCNGTGVVTEFDLKKIISAPDLSLEVGAIPGWDMRNAAHYEQLKRLEPVLGFSVRDPWSKLTAQVQEAILMGTEETKALEPPFEGILTQMQQLWSDDKAAKYLKKGLENLRSEVTCPTCHGKRIRSDIQHVYLTSGSQKYSLPEVEQGCLSEMKEIFDHLQIEKSKQAIAERLVSEISARLTFLENVGLGYLTLDRRTDSLSGGESQRIKLASQIGSGLSGVLYVLDEPSIGLHQRDNDKLLESLRYLRDLGNTLVVVEHDEDTIRSADYVVDIGEGAGELGGRIMATGTPEEIMHNPASLTGQYLSGIKRIEVPKRRKQPNQGWLVLEGASGNNLKNLTFKLPMGLLTTVTGLSGSGKSSLVIDTLFKTLSHLLNRSKDEGLPYKHIDNYEAFEKVVMVDQSPIGRTPRSNPATYTGLFTLIRDVFGQTQMSRERGYTSSRFSFNVKGGRCEACQGDGVIKMEMHFLPDVYVPCEVCHGRRYNRETLEVKYKGLDISEVLDLTVTQALELFEAYPKIRRILHALDSVGLGYIRLGQSATTFSGGEAQRMKLATELARPESGRTLYILDEPTTGLHFEDIAQLLKVFRELIKAGNTVLVIEHNLDIVKASDYVIDMGPEGGVGGGYILAEGTPEEVAKNPNSVTAPYLKKVLAK